MFLKKDFCRAMHHASLNDFFINGFIQCTKIRPIIDKNGIPQPREEKHIVLGPQDMHCRLQTWQVRNMS